MSFLRRFLQHIKTYISIFVMIVVIVLLSIKTTATNPKQVVSSSGIAYIADYTTDTVITCNQCEIDELQFEQLVAQPTSEIIKYKKLAFYIVVSYSIFLGILMLLSFIKAFVKF